MVQDNTKNLKDMSLEELWQLFPIVLKEYNPDYPDWYQEEKNNLFELLKEQGICSINHIGSTAVEGLISKPIVDILLELITGYNMNAVVDLLENNGWLVMARTGVEQTIDLNKGYTPDGFAEKVFHLHIRPMRDYGEPYFRDYLRSHPDVAKEYATLKLALKEKYEHDRDAYTNAKTEFVLKYTDKAMEEAENDL